MAGSRNERPQSVQLIEDEFGVRLFRPPPDDFNPVEASDRELLVHGFPARPDVRVHPELFERWRRVMSQRLSMIQPEFAPMPEWNRQGRRVPAPTSGDGWCGSAVLVAKGDTFVFVSGQWTVPNVVGPQEQLTVCGCAEWVGIDGSDELSPDILQAGTTQIIVPIANQHRETFAWFEWYPAPPTTISNFPVSPGDVVACVICVHSPTEAGIYMNNLTRGVLTSFIKKAPDKVRLKGNTAEWILESPANGYLGPLAKYAEVYFDYCAAGSGGASGGTAYLGGNGTLTAMHDANGQNISKAVRVTDRLIKVRYTGPP